MKTWTDPKTGLEWQAGIVPYMSWNRAVKYVKNLGDCWRLPTIEEFEALLNQIKSDLTIQNKISFRISSGYWSSTPYIGLTCNAWYVGFYHGNPHNFKKSHKLYVLCVRSELKIKTGG